MALNNARFSRKNDSSLLMNLQCISPEIISHKCLIDHIHQKLIFFYILWNNLIKFARTDEFWNFADADFERPPSSKTARSSSLTVSFPNSSRLTSECLQTRKKWITERHRIITTIWINNYSMRFAWQHKPQWQRFAWSCMIHVIHGQKN